MLNDCYTKRSANSKSARGKTKTGMTEQVYLHLIIVMTTFDVHNGLSDNLTQKNLI